MAARPKPNTVHLTPAALRHPPVGESHVGARQQPRVLRGDRVEREFRGHKSASSGDTILREFRGHNTKLSPLRFRGGVGAGFGLSLGVTWEERPHPAGGWGTSLISIVSPEFGIRCPRNSLRSPLPKQPSVRSISLSTTPEFRTPSGLTKCRSS